MTLWVGAIFAGWRVPTTWALITWHAHEMIFGFVAAVIAGFLLTAVPQWTDTARVHGPRLAVLLGFWLLGRLAIWTSPWLPAPVVAVCDLLFIPLLATLVAIPIYKAGRARNFGIPILLLLVFMGNILVHLDVLGHTQATGRTGLHLAVAAVALLTAIIGGRVIPPFTRNSLRRSGDPAVVSTNLRVAQLTIAAMVLTYALEFLGPLLPLSATHLAQSVTVGSLLVACLLVARAWNWRFTHTLDQPILWILHVGQAWLLVAFVCKALGGLGVPVPPSAALHAFTAGAIGTMSLAFMTRAALGHSGRPLEASPMIALAYVLVISGAGVRVFIPILSPARYSLSIALGGLLWLSAYAIYTVVFWPILTRPRIDGRPG